MFFVLNEQNADIITYEKTNQIVLLSDIETLGRDRAGHYYYDYNVEKEADIFDNIFCKSTNSNIQLTYFIGDNKYTPEEVSEFILLSAQNHEFKIRITFLDKPATYNKEPYYAFTISLRYYLLNTQDRRTFLNSIVTSNNTMYKDGMFQTLPLQR